MSMLDQPVGRLAREIPGATRVFSEHNLDFCCGGQRTLRELLAEKGIDPDGILTALAALAAEPEDGIRWDGKPVGDLIRHILDRYHARHREQLPELIRLAARVEQVHGDRPQCPQGLATLLQEMHQEMESHMLKEEQVLFPMLSAALYHPALRPISMMRFEHDQHGVALARLMQLTDDLHAPAGACTTWRALYTGLRQFRDDLMQHIHLENNVLFANAESAAGELS